MLVGFVAYLRLNGAEVVGNGLASPDRRELGETENRKATHVLPADCASIEKYLAEGPEAPGLHILCFHDSSVRQEQNTLTTLVAYMNGHRDNRKEMVLDLSERKMASDFTVFQAELQRQLGFSKDTGNGWGHHEFKQDYGLFDSEGNQLSSVQEVKDSVGVFLFEGGQFMWPGVRKGFQHELRGLDTGSAVLETVSLRPLVFEVRNFLTESECQHIISKAAPKLENSGVAHMDKDVGKPATEWRTSTQTWLSSRGNDKIRNIDERVAKLTHIPMPHQEQVQVLRYELSQKYDSHHDCFDPVHYPSRAQDYDYGHKNRIATVFWYMTDVEEGGETVFPMADGAGFPPNFTTCAQGLRVKPEKGKVIIFYSLLPNGDIDKTSLHGGCPVKQGTKWAANKWVWNKPSGYN